MQRQGLSVRWPHALIVLFCLLFALQPLLVWAAPATQIKLPKASKRAPIAYDDPDGLFHIDYPAAFSAPEATLFSETLQSSLDGLQAERAYLLQHDEVGSMAIAFLLMAEPVDDSSAWTAFTAQLLIAYGGEALARLERQTNAEGAFVVYVEGEPADNHIMIYSQGVGSVAMVFTATVPNDQWKKAQDSIEAAFDSLTWDPDAATMVLNATVAEAQVADNDTATAALVELPELMRFHDPDETFTLKVPALLEARVDTSKPNAYGYGFYEAGANDANTIAFPTLSVSFVLAQQVLSGTVNAPVQALRDEEWLTLIEKLATELGQAGELTDDRRNAGAHTAYLVTETKFDETSGLRLLTWWEERDGVLANISLYAPLDPTGVEMMQKLLTELLTSFSWSSSGVTALIGRLAESTAPTLVNFTDPFGLLGVALPAEYPLFAVYYDGTAMNYQFGAVQTEGVIHLTLNVVNDATFSADDWAEVVKASEEQIVQVVTTDESAGELIVAENEAPVLDNGNRALLRAGSDSLQAGMLLQETDGVLAVVIVAAPTALWEARQAALLTTLTTPVTYDPTAVRDFLDGQQAVGTGVLAATMTAGRPVDGQEIVTNARFVPTDTVALIVALSGDPALTGELDLQLFLAPTESEPVLQANVDLSSGERVETRDYMVKFDQESAKIALFYQPEPGLKLVDSPNYLAKLYYNGYLLAVYGFAVTTPPGSGLSGLPAIQLMVNDGQAATPATSVLNVFHANDTAWIRGTIDMPADSQVRLFWYDEQGNLYLDAIQTITLPVAQHGWIDWFLFALSSGWTPATYHAMITLNGEAVWSGDYTVLPQEEAVALDIDSAAFYKQLALPADHEVVEAVEGIDYAFTTSLLTTNVFDLIGSWLRGQGWQSTFPLLDAPAEAQLHRWVKDSFQFIVQLGGDNHDQFWLQYRTIAKQGFTPVPSGQLLSVDTLALADEMAKVTMDAETITDVAFAPNNRWLAVTTDEGMLGLFSLPEKEMVQWWRINDGIYQHPIFSPDSRQLAVAINGDDRATIQRFSYFDTVWIIQGELNGHRAPMTSLAFADGGGTLVSGGQDGTLRFWTIDGTALTQRSTLETPVTNFAMAADGTRLGLGLEGGVVALYNPVEQQEIASFVTAIGQPHVYLHPQVEEEASGQVIIAGDGRAELWRYADGEGELAMTYEPSDALYTVNDTALSPDGSLLVTVGNYVIFFDAASGERLVTWSPTNHGEGVTVQTVGFSPDGQFLWAIDEQGVLHVRGVLEGNG